MENFTPPTVTETTDNAIKTADSFEKKPMATSFAIVVFMMALLIIYLGYQNNKLQTKLNDMATTAFNNAMLQKKTIEVQSEAIKVATEKLTDSTQIKIQK